MKTQRKKKHEAFTLVEVMIALGIATVCMVSLQGLIPSSLKIANNGTDQTSATTMLTSIAQDLRNTPSGSNTSPGFGIPMPSSDSTNSTLLTSTNFYLAEDGLGVLSPSQARYAASVTLSNAASATVTSLTMAHIKVYWPASASISNALGSVETVTFFNRQFQRDGVYVAKKTGSGSGSCSCTSSNLCVGPYDKNGYNSNGYDCHGYNSNGYNEYGYDCHGYNSNGYDCNGYNCSGYNCNGYNCSGYDCNGYNQYGFNCNGYNQCGEHQGCGSCDDHGCGEDD